MSTTKAIAKKVSMTSPSGVTYSIELITPQTAALWLGRNTANRNMRRTTAESYARDMESGDWQENGDAICFAEDGTLLDGQHRLNAVVIAGIPVLMLVVRNLPSATQDTKDDGRKRTMADTFGFHGVANNATAAAVTRRVLLWQNGVRSNSGGGYLPTKAEQLEVWRTDPTLRSAVEATVSIGKKGLVPPSVIGLSWWLFSQLSVEDCSTFWHGMSTGANLPAGSPILALRERVSNLTDARVGRVPESHLLAWVIKAWNLYRADKTVASNYRGFNLKPLERFPEPR